MKEHKVRVIVLADGRVVVEGVPVTKGQMVDVTIQIDDQFLPGKPLGGLPFRYDDPYEPAVDESEWDALK